ncbi:Potassium efflux system KefA precursor [Legionella massiliensis]|uniref:Potassium efflux system KefA n=1 Tax=Legionella massiliensis TaxID=1034943 RepID=A0A078KZI9_9GAMM|nr:mechanosensitive ion channel domain-containing protein [Legionella massiliensis]CDZ78341.1 Potassium efflux system KefA precursor [Legionella massiliensis]CEE14079.1 Mechanosensitive channel MscK precursor [Legionella massiliensis]
MLRRLKLAFFLLGLICNLSYSAEVPETLGGSYNRMVQSSIEKLDQIKSKVKDNKLGIYGLDRALSDISQIQNIATECLQISTDSIERIKPLMESLSNLDKNSPLGKKYNRDKSLFENQRASCQALSYETHKVNYFIQLRLHELKYVHAESDIWFLLAYPNLFNKKISINNAENILDFNVFTYEERTNFLYIALFVCLTSLFIARFFHRLEVKTTLPKWKFFYRKSRHYFPMSLLLLAEIIYMSYLTLELQHRTHIVIVMEFLLMLITAKYIIDIYLYVFLNQPKQWMDNIRRNYSLLNLIMIINLSFDFLIIDIFVKNHFTMFLIIVLNIVISPIFYFVTCKVVKACFDEQYISAARHWFVKPMRYGLYLIFGLIYLTRIIASIYGYERVVMTMDIEMVTVTALILLIQMMFYVLKQLGRYIQNDDNRISNHIRKILGVAGNGQDIFEINMLRITLQGFIVVFLILLVIPIFRLPSFYEYEYRKIIFDGFSIGYIEILPINILLALLMFSCIVLVGKYLSNSISQLPRFKYDVNIRTSITMIIQYIFFAIAFVIMMLVMGVGSAQLSVIIGAVSFGIGVGLQSLTQDVICGITIMFNRTIRISDHITILHGDEKTLSGVVNKVYLLSTMIITDDDNIVYVPNSYLARELVRNESAYSMVPNCILRFELESEVDFELAHKLVHEVCRDNPEIIGKFDEEPQLAFLKPDEHAETKIILTLSYSLKRAEDKRIVLTELKQAISNAFDKNGIAYQYL